MPIPMVTIPMVTIPMVPIPMVTIPMVPIPTVTIPTVVEMRMLAVVIQRRIAMQVVSAALIVVAIRLEATRGERWCKRGERICPWVVLVTSIGAVRWDVLVIPTVYPRVDVLVISLWDVMRDVLVIPNVSEVDVMGRALIHNREAQISFFCLWGACCFGTELGGGRLYEGSIFWPSN